MISNNKGGVFPINIKAKKPLLIKISAVILLVLLCYNLPSLPFYLLCLKEDLFRPPNTEVLVSACKGPVVRGVPGGEVLFVRERRTDKMYLLDLRTGEKRDVPDDPLFLDNGIFLSSELVWLEGSSVGPDNPSYRPHYILDLTDGKRYELLDLTWLPLLNGNKFDPKYYAYFQSAKQVFIHHGENNLIAVSDNFRQHPEGNVIFSQYSLESGASAKNGELLEQLMKDLGVDYEIVDLSLYYADIPSPTGRYIIRSDGIYLSGTNTLVVTSEYTGKRLIGDYFVSWYYDESGMVMQGSGYPLITLPGTSSFYYIPSAVLKLRLPAP
ncbi:MAG: hypothetical protein H7Y59_20345 [Anaerolineales bacterium]|nr:hypothetical protein [Anaerolineales bacterium]